MKITLGPPVKDSFAPSRHRPGQGFELSDEAESEMEDEEEHLLKSLGWKGKGLIQSACTTEDDEDPLVPYILIDGMLLSSRSQISDTNAKAIREALARGVKVVIATGKTRPAVLALLKMVDLSGRDGIASR
ncbi:hypothetical protein R6Q57_016637, partial [Mikania cordata]